MKITKSLAQQIVDAVSEVVKKDINFIDHKGIIIGSTDSKRLSSFHEAGFMAVKMRKPVLVEPDSQFKGAKEGVNYPIFFDDRTIGAIGITGNSKEVKTFGFLVTKITEVFLKEQQLNVQLESRKRMIHYLMNALLYHEVEEYSKIYESMETLGIKREESYTVFVCKMYNNETEHDLEGFFQELGCQMYLYSYPNEWIAILSEREYQKFGSKKARFETKFEEKLTGGFGSFAPLEQLEQSFANARLARKHAKEHKLVYCAIEDISIEIVLESIQGDIKEQYVRKVLAKLSQKEIDTLRSYFLHDMSLKNTSEALFIHKNTLQYQLDRIYEKTGLNPRKFHDAVNLHLGILLQIPKNN